MKPYVVREDLYKPATSKEEFTESGFYYVDTVSRISPIQSQGVWRVLSLGHLTDSIPRGWAETSANSPYVRFQNVMAMKVRNL